MIIVTGASGAFGRAAAARLIERIPAGELILTSRTPEKLADFAARGADVRAADFDDPTTLDKAFAGGTKLLLISTARVGTRVGQHANAIAAARRAGVGHIAYTSVLGAAEPGNPALVKLDHRATEEIIEGSGAAFTFLRDSQYAEAIAAAMVPGALAAGRIPDNAHEGRVAFVSREDCVACATEVLLQGAPHERRAYDITGPELMTIPAALALASEIAGRPIVVLPVDDEGMLRHFDSLGIPRHASDVVPEGPIRWSSDDMVTFGRSIREGYFDKLTPHVRQITGREPRSLREVMLAHRNLWPV
jgi:NAD(P)H dehydrogenase (quinone)